MPAPAAATDGAGCPAGRGAAPRRGGLGVPATRWLLAGASWPLWAAAFGLMLVTALEVLRVDRHVGMDNEIIVRAARTLLDGGAPYADKRFLYLPSAVLVAVPEALLPHGLRWAMVPVVAVVLTLAGWVISLRVFGVSARSRLAALGVVGFAFFAPFKNLAIIGNWTLAAVVAFPLSVLLALRSRWVAAGAVIGLALAIKPMLAPMVLLLVFARRWRALAVAVGVPMTASAVAVALMPAPGLFVTKTLPFLLHGQDNFAKPFDASLGMVLSRLGAPGPVAYGVGVLAAGTGLVCAWLRWRRADEGPLRVAETALALMLSTFLVSRPSFDHYLMVVTPLLLASVVLPGTAPRTVWFWVALLPQIPGLTWPYLENGKRRAFKDASTIAVLAVVAATTGLRARRARRPRGRRRAAGVPRPAGPEVRDAVAGGGGQQPAREAAAVPAAAAAVDGRGGEAAAARGAEPPADRDALATGEREAGGRRTAEGAAEPVPGTVPGVVPEAF
ncbi:glycosyltransferase family 87 protein [Streptomyces sp. NPDC059740]|uniref:glycosyltransferase family 87 protein n=1 Tax=Streptomyces sp. NPDC059740 TaxID=3346926 RepID=UPI00365B5043